MLGVQRIHGDAFRTKQPRGYVSFGRVEIPANGYQRFRHLLPVHGECGGNLRFVPVPAPSPADLKRVVQRIAERIGRSLERSGLITRDIENAYLTFDPGVEAPINSLLGASITYRIATGPREGQKVFTLQTLPVEPDEPRR